jgi:hypothetical protein
MTVVGVVDALREAQRRLHPAGKVVVLVPAAHRPTVVTRGRVLGRIDDRPFRPALEIVASGLRQIVAAGLFRAVGTQAIDIYDRFANGAAMLAEVPRQWRIGPRLADAVTRVRTPVEVHKRSVLRVLEHP